jgi:hypothetical protein
MGVSTYFRTMNNLLHAMELKDDALHQVGTLLSLSAYRWLVVSSGLTD